MVLCSLERGYVRLPFYMQKNMKRTSQIHEKVMEKLTKKFMDPQF